MTRLNPALQSFQDFQVLVRKDHFKDLKLYRQYTNGEMTARLNKDQIAAFNNDPEHVVNMCPTILNAKCDRLKIEAIEIQQPQIEPVPPVATIQTQAQENTLEKEVMTWWEASGMASGQKDIAFSASRDADSYLIVEYDNETKQPRLVVGLSYDGDTGVDMVYQDDDPTRPIYATKRWKVFTSETDSIRRLNVYYPNRIEKYINPVSGGEFDDANWQPFTDDGDEIFRFDLEGNIIEDEGTTTILDNSYVAAVSWWTDDSTPTGEPLGIAVIHFPNNARGTAYGRSDLADVVPSLQDNLNDASVDLRIATKFSGSPINILFNISQTATTYEYTPGALIALQGVNDQSASGMQFGSTNLEQLIKSKDSIERDIATVSGTPLPMINPTAQVAAEGTLQQQEAPLITRVESSQTVWGGRYEDSIRMMVKLESVFGSLKLSLEAIDDLMIKVIWKSAEIRNANRDAERAKLWLEIGVEPELIMKHVLGMDAPMIAKNAALKEEREALVRTNQGVTLAGELAAALREEPSDNGTGQRESTEVIESPTPSPELAATA